MISLYRKNANSIGTWRIWAEGKIIHIAHATVMGGSEVRHTEEVDDGKQGRTLGEQVQSRILSRISRMRDRGYKDTLDDARTGTSNQLGLDRPMLAQSITKVRNPNTVRAVLQKKLNGHRCLVTKQEGEIVAYTRQGKPIPSIKHIIQALAPRIPEGVTIDGELYAHGVKLQTIASWIKREQSNTYDLNLVCYDVMAPDRYIDRHAELASMVQGAMTDAPGKVLVLPYEPFTDFESMIRRRDVVRAAGFEGMMLRLDGRGYEAGQRSSSLLKVKVFEDDEFQVTDVIQSSDGWGICVCRTKDGKPFKTSAPGNFAEKEEVLRNKDNYIGRMLTVEYAELTADGIPFHCSATGWKDDL